MPPTLFSKTEFAPFASRTIEEWRSRVLDGVLRGVLVLWVIALIGGINNAYETYQVEAGITPNALPLFLFILFIYIGSTGVIAIITFSRRFSYHARAGILLAAIYLVGTVGLYFSSLSGDGRVLLFAFIVLAAIFFDVKYSLTAFFAGVATMIGIGWLQVQGYVLVPAERQVNSLDAGAWISGTIVFVSLGVAVLISVHYLLRALAGNIEDSNDLLKREQRLSQILRTVTDINKLIVREQDDKKLLEEACSLLVTGQGYSYAWIGLLEADQASLRMAAQAGDGIEPSKFSIRVDEQIPNGITCAARALQTRAYFVVEHDDDDPCVGCPRRDKALGHSSIALTLKRDERNLGVLVVEHHLPSTAFDAEEVGLLQDLTDDLAYALEKLQSDRRLAEYADRQHLLNEITSAALKDLDMETLLGTVTHLLANALGADEHCVKLWNDETKRPSLTAKSQGMMGMLNFPSPLVDENLLFDAVIQSRQPLIGENLLDAPYIRRDIAAGLGIQAMLGLPLIANDQVLGVVICGYRQTRTFTESELELAQQAAGQIALAAAKSRLNLEIRARAAELERLYAAAQDMASSLWDAPALLEKLARHMAEAVQVTSGYIVSIDFDSYTMQVVAEYWGEAASDLERTPDLNRVYPAGNYATVVRTMLDGEVLILQDDDEHMTDVERAQFGDYGVRTMMFIPIMAHGQLLGDIELWESRHRREFSETDIRLAKAMSGHAASIIENLKLVNALRSSETRYRTLVEQAADGIFLADQEHQYVDANPSGCAMLGYSREELLTLRMEDIVFPEELSARPFRVEDLRAGRTVVMERRLRRKDGTFFPAEISARMLPNGYMQGIVRDISERKQSEQALAEREAYFRALIENSAEGVAILDGNGIIRYISPTEERLTGYVPQNVIGKSAFLYIHPKDKSSLMDLFAETVKQPGVIHTAEYRMRRRDGKWRHFEITGHNLLDDPHIAGVVINYRDVTERKRAEQALQESQSRLQAVITNALNGIITIDSRQRIIMFNPSAERVFGFSAADVLGQRLEVLIPDVYHSVHSGHVQKFSETGHTSRLNGLLDSLYGKRANGEVFPMEAFLSTSEVEGEKFFTVIFQDITERRHAEEELRRHALELESLAAASSALRTAQNVTEMIPILALHALRAVHGTYSSIFLLDSEMGEYVSRGWFSAEAPFEPQSGIEASLRHPPGEGITGRVGATGEIYVTQDIHTDSNLKLLDGEKERLKDVHGGISLPLRTQDETIGVMHIWSDKPRIFSDSDIRLLIALAETASNAIHRAILFEQTQQHAEQLARAYDNTLAGWARALELRDELTEGHTRRVTELTLKLARALNLSESDLVQIRRGALLHDIGKMGIPDSILHKPGAFTVQERQIMQQHPQYAYEMLSSIPFLQAAIDIPYCHHEHWDGNGYPRGLKGEQIPLAARIFAVVDVWDALTSDRPYRPAWSQEKTRQYILERSGLQFDPHIVKVFFLLLDAKN